MSNEQKYTYSRVFHRPEGPFQALRQAQNANPLGRRLPCLMRTLRCSAHVCFLNFL
jgi:hypothetical protein